MARFRVKRTHPRIAGTKNKHSHDSLHLLETARVKVNKARVRLPREMAHDDYLALLHSLNELLEDVEDLRRVAYEAAAL